MILIFTFKSHLPLLKEKGGRSGIFNIQTNPEKNKNQKNFSFNLKFVEIM
jgi:hypothetical protein